MAWEGLPDRGNRGKGEEKNLEDSLLKGFEALRPSNGLGRAPRAGSGGRENLGRCSFERL